VKNVEELVKKAVSRRSFLAGASTAAAATVLVGCSSGNSSTTTTPVTTTPVTTTPGQPSYADADYLNFALNLEYLEAEFYLNAATGSGLSSTDAGSGAGTVTGGGTMVTGLNSYQQANLYEIAQNELDHVRLLRSALGSAAVARPAINLSTSFSALAVAAGIVATGGTFTPFDSAADFLLGAFIFEDVGVTAYLGAAPLLTSKAYLTVAAEIMAVEAYHAASIRSQLVYLDSLAPSKPYLAYANDISALRATLGGGGETALSATSIVPCDGTNAIAFSRNVNEILHIVYATGNGAGATAGGFFPTGMNGTIKQTYS